MPDYSRYQPIVRRWSTIRIGRRAYSVPSRLIGHRVEVRQHAPRLEDAGYEASLPTLLEFFELEREARWVRRLARLRKASKLPPAKSFDTFDDARLPRPLARQLRELARGDFLERAVNVLAFGLPGTGKSHAACALGHPLVDRGHSVLWRAQTRTSTTVLET
ncbi:MAG: ATP-binding protein [Thermoanaerobaculia bacterium]